MGPVRGWLAEQEAAASAGRWGSPSLSILVLVFICFSIVSGRTRDWVESIFKETLWTICLGDPQSWN